MDRPVTGKSIVDLKCSTGSIKETSDIMWHLALDAAHYAKAVTKTAHIEGGAAFNQPIPDMTRAVMVRFLTQHPDKSALSKDPSATEVFSEIRSTPGYEDFTQSDFGILFGREPQAGIRWLKAESDNKRGESRSRLVRKAMLLLHLNLKKAPAHARQEMLDNWCKSLMDEARARGVGEQDMMSKHVFGKKRTEPKARSNQNRRSNLSGSPIWQAIAKRLYDSTGQPRGSKK